MQGGPPIGVYPVQAGNTELQLGLASADNEPDSPHFSNKSQKSAEHPPWNLPLASCPSRNVDGSVMQRVLESASYLDQDLASLPMAVGVEMIMNPEVHTDARSSKTSFGVHMEDVAISLNQMPRVKFSNTGASGSHAYFSAASDSNTIQEMNWDLVKEIKSGPLIGSPNHFVHTSFPAQKPNRLYRLMMIASDKQDLSFVEKVIVPKDELRRLCNDVGPLPASYLGGDGSEGNTLNFKDLDTVARRTIGMYGSKAIMTDILERSAIGIDRNTLAEMRCDRLSPGLYASISESFLYLFYWHQGTTVKESSRKDISCNFVRYIADLCNTVYVCLEVEMSDVTDALFSVVPDVSKKQRTQRLRVARVKASEDRVQISHGFTVSRITGSEGTKSNPGPCTLPDVQFLLSEGIQRMALLSARLNPPKVDFISERRVFKMKEFPQVVEGWFKLYNVDLAKIADADFRVWLAFSGLKGGTELRNLHESIESRKYQQAVSANKLDDIVEVEVSLLTDSLTRLLNAYLKSRYPWEEGLLKCIQSTSSGHGEPIESDKIVLKTTETEDQDDPVLRRLEDEVYEVLLGENATKSPVFSGQTLKLLLPDFAPRPGKSFFYTLQKCSQFTVMPHDKRLGPILCGKDVLLSSTNGEGVPVAFRVTFKREKDPGYEGPMLTNERLCISGRGPLKIGLQGVKDIIVTVDPCCPEGGRICGLRGWIDIMAQASFPNLLANAALLTFLGDDESELLRSTSIFHFWHRNQDNEFLQGLLASKNPLDLLRSRLKFPQGRYESLKGEFTKFQERTGPHYFLAKGAITKDIAAVSAVLYKDIRDDFERRIRGIFRKNFTTIVQERIKAKHDEDFRLLEAIAEEEERLFLKRTKEELCSQIMPDRKRLILSTCRPCEKSSLFRSWSTASDSEKLAVTYTREVPGKEIVSWKASEMSPMKDDLDKLNTDPDHQFRPSCSQALEVIQLDPSVEKLLKVILLKQGQVLVFVHHRADNAKEELHLYISSRLGVSFINSNPNKVIKRGIDLSAFDEGSNLLAFYDRSESSIQIARLDDSCRRLDWIGASINLGEYSGSCRLIWMEFVTGKNELAVIDEDHRVRVFEINYPVLLRPKYIHLGPKSFVKACLSTQGSCLLVVRERESLYSEKIESSVNVHSPSDTDVDCVPKREKVSELMLEIYKLDDTMLRLDTVMLDIDVKDPSHIQAAVVSYGAQMHLVLHNGDNPDAILSKVLKISTESEVCKLRKVNRPSDPVVSVGQPKSASVPFLDYLYHIYDKYSTSPPLVQSFRRVFVEIVLKSPPQGNAQLKEKCKQYFNSSLERLEREKGKIFSSLSVQGQVHDFQDVISSRNLLAQGLGNNGQSPVSMGEWLRTLVCLIPIQIARAENNGLKPLSDGLQLSCSVNYGDAVSLANAIHFGFYEAILADWRGPIKIISSMGKQSSGKSYLLNHLSGSLLDVAGGRCTDGVWMTMRRAEGCLYVLLDFEGLGSFERTEQEDMLLSILNAAVSNITIFNKKDFHLDKETEAIFDRFQNGVGLVKKDEKLFKGLFYMAIKDVDSSDVEDLKTEFYSKIFSICNKSESNFLTTMYGGEIEVAAMPSFNKSEFHESIAEIGRAVDQLEPCYQNGKSFSRDLKLVIAQISAKDWSPIDSKRVALRINLLRKALRTAISVGAISVDGSRKLTIFDTDTDVVDEPVQFGCSNFTSDICDTGLELIPVQKNRGIGHILLPILMAFKRIVLRKGQNDEDWHSSLENFVVALADRRKERVMRWLTLNTADFQNDGDVQKLQLEAVAMLAEMKQSLSLCSCKCGRCFLRCTHEKGHPAAHSCMGDHTCKESCTYCQEQGDFDNECDDVAGHEGPHDCKEKSHTCGKPCSYVGISSNCNMKCSLKSSHVGAHLCNSRQHMCNKSCSLPVCKNLCVTPLELGDHDIHKCHEKFCPMSCSMQGCNRSCGTRDHLHSLDSTARHFCGSTHVCPEKCESPGNCDVLTELLRKTQVFKGKRATFEYDHVSEQNGIRKGCCIPIPPFEDTHRGPHLHTTNEMAVHHCETRCRCCGYFCSLPIGHAEVHNTTHGNMRDVRFASESEEIEMGDRKYAWGESGEAEMCNMFCKSQGRGHIHLIPCPTNEGGTCMGKFFRDGARHETKKYGPDLNCPKDEMTHSTFWKQMRFLDPCSSEEQQQFDLCNHECESTEHRPPPGTSTAHQLLWQKHKSLCTQKQWHEPLPKSGLANLGGGYITDDGHHFNCDHTKTAPTNVIFVIDKSGSMRGSDIRPTMTQFRAHHDNRLGCVFEAILNFIKMRVCTVRKDLVSVVLFDDDRHVAIDLQEMNESVVSSLLSFRAAGRTKYSSGLAGAEGILLRASQNPVFNNKNPVMIFLSDGGNCQGDTVTALGSIKRMMTLYPKLIIHTIMFGRDQDCKILKKMNKAGHGTFQLSLDEVELAKSFEGLANSLRPKVSSLM